MIMAGLRSAAHSVAHLENRGKKRNMDMHLKIHNEFNIHSLP